VPGNGIHDDFLIGDHQKKEVIVSGTSKQGWNILDRTAGLLSYSPPVGLVITGRNFLLTMMKKSVENPARVTGV